MWQDLRFGLRMLLKQPAFSLIAILTLALGIGATSAVFSLVEGVLLTPPPYRQPDRLVLIPPARSDGRQNAEPRGWAALQWMEWPKLAKSFESVAAYQWSFNFLVLNDGSESIEGMWVTRDYFRVLGLQAILGRTFLESETGPTAAPVIVLGYNLWQRKFNGDPNIIGKKVRISRQDTPPTVIGVMPPGVRFLPSPGAAREPNYNVNALVDFWAPAGADPRWIKEPMWDVVGRLRDGVSLTRAQSELRLVTAHQAQAEHDFAGVTPQLHSLTAEMNLDGRHILLPLLGAAALVLLIACGNAAALLLVRGLQRQQEYAVRNALGVGRAGLFRQVSAESLLLALTGAVLGVGLAFGVVRVFKAIGGHAIPRLDAVTMGWPVLACSLGSAVLAALLAGIFPALRASRLDPVQVLKSAGPKSSAGRGERRLLRAVTLFQTALTLALLVGAGLLIRTMMNISKVQSGYHTGHILTMSVTAVQGKWGDFHHPRAGPDVLDLGLERPRHLRADRAEADTAVSEGEAGRATGLECPAREVFDRVEHGHVHPLHRARQDVAAEVGLVDIDSDPPDSTLACRLQRPEAAGAGDLEHDSRSLRDLAQGNRSAFHRVDEVVGIGVQRRDARIGSSRACLVAGYPSLDRRHRLAGDRADHLLPGRERQHERSQVTGQIPGLLFPEHEAHDVLRAMRRTPRVRRR